MNAISSSLYRLPLLLFRDAAAYMHATWMRACWRAYDVHIGRAVTLRTSRRGGMSFGRKVSVGPGSVMIVSDERSPAGMPKSQLIVGDGSAINEYCNFRAAGGTIRIGENCIFAQMVTIVASNHSIALGSNIIDQPWDSRNASVWLGDDVWVGANSVLLPGTVIDSGAVIAAGAVVRGHVPSNEVWGGVPAKQISKRK